MNKKTKVFIAQFICFAVLFIIVRIPVEYFTELSSLWGSVIGAVVATIFAPQFKVFDTQQGQKVYMRWIFIKGVKELKW